ncbi:MAG: hypothetical protein Q9201_004308 [Fulgogasparrea decipioides]
MKLPPAEAALLVNLKIYVTRADETLSEKGITMLTKISPLQNLLCRVARVAPEALERVLAGPLEIIKLDKERREMEDQERRELADQARREKARKRAADAKAAREAERSKKRRLANGALINIPFADISDAEGHDSMDEGSDSNASIVGEDDCNSAKENSNKKDTMAQTLIASALGNSKGGKGMALKSGLTNASNPLSKPPAGASNPSVSKPDGSSFKNPEIAIWSQDPNMVQQLTYDFKNIILPKHPRRVHPEKTDEDLQEALDLCPKLNFDTIKYKLLEFADRRQKKPGTKARIIDLEDNAEPMAIFNAIQMSAANETDAKLHRVYGQMRLVKSIDAQVAAIKDPEAHAALPDAKDPRPSGFFLSELAYNMCEDEPEEIRRKTKGKLKREYAAGKQWMKMVKDCGGEGMIFVFIFAGKCIPHSHPHYRSSPLLTGES